jgi:hypothetical protein
VGGRLAEETGKAALLESEMAGKARRGEARQDRAGEGRDLLVGQDKVESA